MRKMYPLRNEVYTLAQIQNDLELRDGPSLNFVIRAKDASTIEACLQDSHVTTEELLTVPGFADSKWRYHYETSEWIPVFYYSDENEKPITDFIDFEEHIDPHRDEPDLWCTPKGFPREQYYYRDEHGAIRRRHDGKRHNEY